ncbi:MAG: hypothetical protein JWO53_146 [Chlamydiia bacterium]|nr:hypothetical protein [Chlamydiia bacterium]
MKQYTMYATTLLLSLSSFMSAEIENEKIYIPKEFIELTDQGALLFLSDETILSNALFFDENGYFVYDARSIDTSSLEDDE